MAEKGPPALTATGVGCTDQDRALEVTQYQPDLTGKGGGDLGRGQDQGPGMEEGSEVGRAEGGCLCTLEAQPRFPETLGTWPHAAVTSLPICT